MVIYLEIGNQVRLLVQNIVYMDGVFNFLIYGYRYENEVEFKGKMR